VWASNSKRDCDAWSLLLLAATVRRFVHIPLGISDRNNIKVGWVFTTCFKHNWHMFSYGDFAKCFAVLLTSSWQNNCLQKRNAYVPISFVGFHTVGKAGWGQNTSYHHSKFHEGVHAKRACYQVFLVRSGR